MPCETLSKEISTSILRLVLVNKAYNKTPYELFNGITHAIGFLKPFGCHVMILNTLDNLDEKKDVSSLRYIVLPNWGHEEHLESTLSQPQGTRNTDVPESSGNSNPTVTSNTPMDKENPWGKDGTGKDVDLHLYRSMIGSLMYLTASRPDIMFAVYACARHQVTPKECHLHAV
nr:putative mitochondrial protein [Tanacetum cinerariifolium]